MGTLSTEERIVRLEERQEAMETAFRAILFADYTAAQEQGRDGLASDGLTALAPDEYCLNQAEKSRDASARRRRILDRAAWLLDVDGDGDGDEDGPAPKLPGNAR